MRNVAGRDSQLRTPFDRYDAGVLLASAIYLCFNLFCLKGTPFLLGGDEQVFWMNAQRLLQGELIYRDFFEFTRTSVRLSCSDRGSGFQRSSAAAWHHAVLALLSYLPFDHEAGTGSPCGRVVHGSALRQMA